MTLESRISAMIEKHPSLIDNDNMLVANVYAELYPNRYSFNQFLYNLADGKVPSFTQIIQTKNQIQNEKSI